MTRLNVYLDCMGIRFDFMVKIARLLMTLFLK